MSEVKKPRAKSKRSAQTWKRRSNAIDITLYSLTGDSVSSDVRKQFEQAAFEIAVANDLVINVATS